MIIQNNLSKIKNEILPACLQGNYIYSLGELSNTSYDVFGAERVKAETIYHAENRYFRVALERIGLCLCVYVRMCLYPCDKCVFL